MATYDNHYSVAAFMGDEDDTETEMKWSHNGTGVDAMLSVAQLIRHSEERDPLTVPIKRIVIEVLPQDDVITARLL